MKRLLYILALALTLAGCVPSGYKEASQTQEALDIYPDYTGVVMPVNIAPMNFKVLNQADACVVEIISASGTIAVKGPVVSVPVKKWHAMLEAAKGGELVYNVYVKRDGKWFSFAEFSNTVAPEPIDEYVTYRLIEPGYSYYGQILLRQRHLTDFKEADLYNNSLISQPVQQQCINCHSFQNYHTQRMQFHVREEFGGTVLTEGKSARKVNFKEDGVIPNGVYPAWHPIENLLTYSVNVTNQVFLRDDPNRLEVYDSMSDLVLYDLETDTMRYILHDSDELETFPAWSLDGRTLYYASAKLSALRLAPGEEVYDRFERIKYSLYAIPFDPVTRTFGESRIIYDAVSDSLSAVTPKPSPDGRFLLSAVGPYGCFQIWHDNADLFLTDLRTLETRPLQEVNSEWAESYHAWSSNSRWILFASRRDDRTYSRLYIAHVDEDGQASKPFLLPQRNPRQNLSLLKSYNVPEFIVEPIQTNPKKLLKAVRQDPVQVRLAEQ